MTRGDVYAAYDATVAAARAGGAEGEVVARVREAIEAGGGSDGARAFVRESLRVRGLPFD